MEIKGLKFKELTKEILTSIVDFELKHSGNLEIILLTESSRIIVTYNRFISYRFSFESYLLSYWEETVLYNEDEGIIFFKLYNSSYLDEIKKLSKNFIVDGGGDSIEHHAIFLGDECIEILTDDKPIIQIENI